MVKKAREMGSVENQYFGDKAGKKGKDCERVCSCHKHSKSQLGAGNS